MDNRTAMLTAYCQTEEVIDARQALIDNTGFGQDLSDKLFFECVINHATDYEVKEAVKSLISWYNDFSELELIRAVLNQMARNFVKPKN